MVQYFEVVELKMDGMKNVGTEKILVLDDGEYYYDDDNGQWT